MVTWEKVGEQRVALTVQSASGGNEGGTSGGSNNNTKILAGLALVAVALYFLSKRKSTS